MKNAVFKVMKIIILFIIPLYLLSTGCSEKKNITQIIQQNDESEAIEEQEPLCSENEMCVNVCKIWYPATSEDWIKKNLCIPRAGGDDTPLCRSVLAEHKDKFLNKNEACTSGFDRPIEIGTIQCIRGDSQCIRNLCNQHFKVKAWATIDEEAIANGDNNSFRHLNEHVGNVAMSVANDACYEVVNFILDNK